MVKKLTLDKIHPLLKKTFGQLYEDTQRRARYIRSKGFRLIEIWESEWQNQLQNIFNIENIIDVSYLFKN